jgi:hypothetical protein
MFQLGDRVVTNNLDWATVVEMPDAQGWYRVRLDTGGIDMMNAARLTRTHPFGDRDPRKV